MIPRWKIFGSGKTVAGFPDSTEKEKACTKQGRSLLFLLNNSFKKIEQ